MTEGPRALHRSTPAELQARLEKERDGVPFLLLRDGVGAQLIVPLPDDATALSIGRDAGADIRLEWDGKVSRLHATLERVGSLWTIADEGLSRNGTFVNHARVTGRRRLVRGDLVRIGETELSYSEPTLTDAQATSMAEDIAFEADLSRTQRRVLAALCRPLYEHGSYTSPATNQEIGVEVHLSTVAVKSHLRTLFSKFALAALPQNRKRAALAEAVLRSGALGPHDFERSA